MKTERQVLPALTVEYSGVPWDSKIFGFNVVQVTRLIVGDPEGAKLNFIRWLARLSGEGVRLVTCRLSCEERKELHLLQQAGFEFIETTLKPEFTALTRFTQPAFPLEVSKAQPHDLPRIETIAHSAFRIDRYHLDERMPAGLADARFAYWVRNAMTRKDQELLKFCESGRIVGFFVVGHPSSFSRHWGLTAIAPELQGRGLGKRAWQSMLARHHDEGVTVVTSSISAMNLPVLNLYAALGARLTSAEASFHVWL